MIQYSWVKHISARALAYHLVHEADQALSEGDRDRCIEMIEKLYELTDIHCVAEVRLSVVV